MPVDTPYNRSIARQILEYVSQEASNNRPQMVFNEFKPRAYLADKSMFQEAHVAGRAYNQKKQGLSKLLRTVGNAVKPLNKNLKPIKKAMTKKAVEMVEDYGEYSGEPVYAEAVDYSDLPSVPVKAGRTYNQKKQGLSKLLRTVGNAVKPLNKNLKPIKQALTKRAVEEIDAYGGAKPNKWISHVKAYASKHGVSYREAMKLAKASYK